MEEKILVRFVSKLKNGQQIIARTGSDSMYPTFKVGQDVKIVRMPFNKIKVGDIIAYAVGKRDKIIVHRVIKIIRRNTGVFLTTKGDNLYEEDVYRVGKTDYIGIVES